MGGPERSGKEVLLFASSKPSPSPIALDISFCTVAPGWWLDLGGPIIRLYFILFLVVWL